MDGGRISFVRTIPIGAARLVGNASEAQLEFMKELNKSMIAYQNQGVGKPLKKLMVTGIVRDLQSIGEEMRRSVPILFAGNIPVEVFPYERYFNMTETGSRDLKECAEASFFELMACITSRDKLQVDLTPKQAKLKRRFREQGRNAATLGITIMSIFLIISLFLLTKIYLKTTLLDKLNIIYDATFDRSRSLEQTSTQSRFVRSFLQSRGKSLYVFEKITDLIGSEVYLSKFQYEDEKKIYFSGTANSMSRVFNFVTALENSGYFSGVNTKQTKSRRQSGRDVADFEIECELKEGFE